MAMSMLAMQRRKEKKKDAEKEIMRLTPVFRPELLYISYLLRDLGVFDKLPNHYFKVPYYFANWTIEDRNPQYPGEDFVYINRAFVDSEVCNLVNKHLRQLPGVYLSSPFLLRDGKLTISSPYFRNLAEAFAKLPQHIQEPFIKLAKIKEELHRQSESVWSTDATSDTSTAKISSGADIKTRAEAADSKTSSEGLVNGASEKPAENLNAESSTTEVSNTTKSENLKMEINTAPISNKPKKDENKELSEIKQFAKLIFLTRLCKHQVQVWGGFGEYYNIDEYHPDDYELWSINQINEFVNNMEKAYPQYSGLTSIKFRSSRRRCNRLIISSKKLTEIFEALPSSEKETLMKDALAHYLLREEYTANNEENRRAYLFNPNNEVLFGLQHDRAGEALEFVKIRRIDPTLATMLHSRRVTMDVKNKEWTRDDEINSGSFLGRQYAAADRWVNNSANWVTNHTAASSSPEDLSDDDEVNTASMVTTVTTGTTLYSTIPTTAAVISVSPTSPRTVAVNSTAVASTVNLNRSSSPSVLNAFQASTMSSTSTATSGTSGTSSATSTTTDGTSTGLNGQRSSSNDNRKDSKCIVM